MDERALNFLNWSVLLGRRILTALLNWFQQIYDTLGMTELWIAAIIMVVVFSVILVPLRGGGDLSKGALGSFVVNQVNKSKPGSKSSGKSNSN